MKYKAYLLSGSNIGDRTNHLKRAIEEIEKGAGKIKSVSSVYETAPWGVTDQQPYLNQAMLIETSLSPHDLFFELKKIEACEGRTDQKKYAPRTLDIDILFYSDLILKSEIITIPHPRLHLRKFVLVPMNEIAAGLFHPLLKKTIHDLLLECEDELAVSKLSK